MLRRVILSAIFIPIIIYIIYADFLNSLLLFLFVLLLSFFTSKEMYILLKRIYKFQSADNRSAVWFYLPGAVIIIIYYINTFFKVNPLFILYTAGFTVFSIFLHAVIKKVTGKGISSFLILLVSYIYTGIFPLIIFIIKQENYRIFVLYFLFLLGWFNDAAAYFIGSFFGRIKGIIKWSPNKSLEGYSGAFILTIAVGLALRFVFGERFPFNGIQTALICLVIAVWAPLGDLFESMAKRKAGMKDSSNFLPGLGGVLDIFDSILMSAPVYYILLRIFFSV